MSNRLPLAQVDAAMLALGRRSIPQMYGSAVDVDGIGPNDFDDEGNLIMRSPMVRLRFQSASYEGKDPQRLTYKAGPSFLALCYCENLRSQQDEKLDTLRLLDAVQECFAGARLMLADGKTTEPTAIGDVLPMMSDGQVIDGFYSVQLLVTGYAQFSGPNANFGGAHA